MTEANLSEGQWNLIHNFWIDQMSVNVMRMSFPIEEATVQGYYYPTTEVIPGETYYRAEAHQKDWGDHLCVVLLSGVTTDEEAIEKAMKSNYKLEAQV